MYLLVALLAELYIVDADQLTVGVEQIFRNLLCRCDAYRVVAGGLSAGGVAALLIEQIGEQVLRDIALGACRGERGEDILLQDVVDSLRLATQHWCADMLWA